MDDSGPTGRNGLTPGRTEQETEGPSVGPSFKGLMGV